MKKHNRTHIELRVPHSKYSDKKTPTVGPRLPKGTILVTRDGINWTEPDDDIPSVRYCKVAGNRYYRMHKDPNWVSNAAFATPVTEAHIKHMVKSGLLRKKTP